ncbi:MAG: hypothetical protein CMN31_13050 [Sandaracinus sp.]|nr:hypothetical protein [Myxococcales bacterium]MAT24356.1 hypothetical protein [Sandaracinus sp.]MBJ72244.1 hypothetical protein [Sandaracinus sp.]
MIPPPVSPSAPDDAAPASASASAAAPAAREPERAARRRSRRPHVAPGWLDALVVAALALAWLALVRPGPLELPYWWDEADVYVPGAKWVAENDLTLTPGVFSDDYSRGHPVLLYGLAGAAFRAFGPGPTTGHLVVLPFTLLALVFTYLLGAQLFGRRAGAAAALLMGTTPLFMSMGNMLLPEMPLTALAVASLYAFAKGRLGWAVLAGCLAVWIKETGVFAAAALAGAALWEGWLSGRWRPALRRFALLTIPIWALVAFFVWQKLHAGYFVFPHHANLFADRPFGLANLATVWPSLLLWHGRWVLVLAALAALMLFRTRWPTDDPLPTRGPTVVAILLLVLANFVFFSKMFWLERYALPAHPGLLVLGAGALLWGARRTTTPRRLLRWAPVVLASAAGFAGLWSPTPPDAEEQTYAYADAIATHRAAFARILAPGDDPTVLTPWPMQVELRHPYLGYVDRPIETIHPRSHQGEPFDYVLFAAESWRAPDLRTLAAGAGFVRLGTFEAPLAQPLELWGPPPEE